MRARRLRTGPRTSRPLNELYAGGTPAHLESTMTEVHPLDREDDNDHSLPSLSPSAPENAVKQKLKRMVWVAAVIGALVVISSVAMNGVTYATQAYWMAYVVNRILMFLLLATFAGILAVYQRANIRKLIENLRDGGSSTLQNATQLSWASRFVSPISILIAVNVVLLALTWALVMFSTTTGPSTGQLVLSTLSILLPGLLTCMIVWHRGFLRAYAIGALTTHFCSTVFFAATWSSFQRGGGGFGSDSFYLGWYWTLVLLGGLIPAIYVFILQKSRSKE